MLFRDLHQIVTYLIYSVQYQFSNIFFRSHTTQSSSIYYSFYVPGMQLPSCVSILPQQWGILRKPHALLVSYSGSLWRKPVQPLIHVNYPKKSTHGLVGKLLLQPKEKDWIKKRKKRIQSRQRGRGPVIENYSISPRTSFTQWESTIGPF